MSISPFNDGYDRTINKSPKKPVRSENAPPHEKLNRQALLKYIRSTPQKKSRYTDTLRSHGSKPLAEVPLKYIGRCIEGVAQVNAFFSRPNPVAAKDPLTWNGTLSGTQENVRIDRTRRVGKGAFSKVWQGVIQKPNKSKTVAVKEFKEKYYERELHVIDQLMRNNSEGLLRIHGKLSEPGGKTHVIMKFCNEGSALQFFNEHLSDKEACYRKLLSMFKVLQDFHRSGFCHRDIHEGNFLSHQPKKGGIQEYLTDFGHAGSLKKEDRLPLYGRPLYLVNSPRVFTHLYNDIEHSHDASIYDQSADEFGKEIDLYQLGILCFRVCVADKGPLMMGIDNPSQVALVKKLEEIQAELDRELQPLRLTRLQKIQRKKALFTEKMGDYFQMQFPSIPRSFASVMIGLLDFPQPMPLEQAMAQWAEAIQYFHEHHG